MKRSELKNKISEALTPDEAAKVDAMYNKIYKNGMLKDNPLKLSKYDNPDAIGAGKSVKLVQKESTKMTEKKLTAAEKDKMEDIIMSMKDQVGGKDKLKPVNYAVAAIKAKKLAEDNLEEEISDATFQKHADRVESLLRQLISATKEVDKSQDDTEDDVEELDQSIDYLASALTDKDPIDIAVDQATFGRLAKPTKEEINLEKIDAIMEEDELTKSEKKKLKKVSSQLKKSVKAHDRQSKIIDKAISETGQEIAKKNMDMYKDKNRLEELVKAALMGPISEKQAKPDFLDLDGDGDKEESMKKAAADKKKMDEESTSKYDDNPALKGKQSKLPDGLQKAIIKKKGGDVDESFDSLVKKVDKEKGYDKKDAQRVAGYIANRKRAGAGKGPTKKMKKREGIKEAPGSTINLSKDDMDKLHSDGKLNIDGHKVIYKVNENGDVKDYTDEIKEEEMISKAKYDKLLDNAADRYDELEMQFTKFIKDEYNKDFDIDDFRQFQVDNSIMEDEDMTKLKENFKRFM